MFPDSINFFGIHFYLFGIIASLSLLLGYCLMVLEMGRLKIPKKIAPDLAFDTLISAFLGARLLFVALNWSHYSVSPLNIFKVWDGGIVLYGGILGGLIGGFLFCWKKNISFLKLSDPVAFGLAFGLALSRLGCLAAGCCYGKSTDLPWGITFNNGLSLATPLHEPLHPTQIYSFLMGMIIFVVLFMIRKRKTFEGELLLVYLFLSSGVRVLIEDRMRADSSPIAGLVAFTIFIVSGVLYFYLKQRSGCMKKSVASLSMLVVVVVLYGACGIVKTQSVSRGYDIKQSDVNSIIKGQTTEQNIIKTFGPPTKVRDTEDGREYFYDYAKSGGPQWNLIVSVGGGTMQKSLFVWFDKKGVVTNYAFKQS